MSEEMGPPCKMHQKIRIRIKEYTIQQEDQAERLPGGVGQTWPGSRPGALRGGVAAKAPDHLPYMRWRETDL